MCRSLGFRSFRELLQVTLSSAPTLTVPLLSVRHFHRRVRQSPVRPAGTGPGPTRSGTRTGRNDACSFPHRISKLRKSLLFLRKSFHDVTAASSREESRQSFLKVQPELGRHASSLVRWRLILIFISRVHVNVAAARPPGWT